MINGILYLMAPPGRTHQRILGSLYRKIADYIESNNGDCEVNIAPFAVYLTDNDQTLVEPDISVVCDPDKLDEKGCHGAPDWVIEVVSPSSKKMDYLIKLEAYKKAGVREYWIVDPREKLILVYDFIAEEVETYHFTDRVPVCIYEGFEIDFAQLL